MLIPPRWLILALLCSGLFFSLAAAQEINQARLSPPETSEFPLISTYLDVRDAGGNFVYGLTPGDLTILEGSRRIQVSVLNQLRPGVQFVVAINPGPAFLNRDIQGNSRYDFLVDALEDWASSRLGSTLDDLSFIGLGGPEVAHQADFDRWVATLRSYQPGSPETAPGFELLSRALEVVADPTPRPGMGRAVLFITALPQDDQSLLTQSLAGRAGQRGVSVFVWLVDPTNQEGSTNAVQLANLATETSGAFYLYSGGGPFPEIESYLEPLRNTYHLSYLSGIVESGAHELAVQVKTSDLEITSGKQLITLEVLPPNIAFISPSLEIKRKSAESNENPEVVLSPSRQSLELLIEFPDGHERSLERSRLFVDGILVQENRNPPFDRFEWDLREYTTTGAHMLKAEVIDSLGLTSATMEISVLVSIDQPRVRNLALLSRNRSLLVGAMVMLAGSVLLLILVMGGRVRPGFLSLQRKPQRHLDPVTQPVKTKIEPKSERNTSWINRFHWPERRVSPGAMALLVRLSESDQPKTAPPISITRGEVTFGRDASLATQVLEDPSIESLHARLRLEEDGSFRLMDEGSIAGTWINYTPISKEGARLQHGDLIHIGRLGFRFVLRESQGSRKPTVTRKEPGP
jgi:hypothetical protein